MNGFCCSHYRYDGAILMAPMVKISEKIKPPEIVTRIFKRVALYLPLSPITPSKDVLDGCFQDKELVKEERYAFDGVYQGAPFLKRHESTFRALQRVDEKSARC